MRLSICCYWYFAELFFLQKNSFMSASFDISLKVEPWGPTYLCCLLLDNHCGAHPFPSFSSLPLLSPPFLPPVFLPHLPLLNLFSLPFLLYIPCPHTIPSIFMDMKLYWSMPTSPALPSFTLSSIFPQTSLSRLLLLLINKIIKVGLLANIAILLPFINNKVTLWIFTQP